MSFRIGILNNYLDESRSAPSAEYFRKYIERADIINICHGDTIDSITKYDGYIISGSRSCHKDKYDWIGYLKQVIKNINNNNIPCLAICFGHQIIADMFGGKTVVQSHGENGFKDVPTKSSDSDITIFNGLPNPAKLYQSHYDSVLEAPPNSVNIIRNDKCVQYFEYGSINSIQSHPEISIKVAMNIAERKNQDVNQILNGVTQETDLSYKIIKNFVNNIGTTTK